jgi:hypothetical protein
MEEKIQKAFNDSVGAILTYLDEAEVGFMCKKAVRAELYELCDRKIKPLLIEGGEHGYEGSGNR